MYWMQKERWTVNTARMNLWPMRLRSICKKTLSWILPDMKKDLIRNDLPGEDGSHIDIAACARKDAPGIVAIYYYTSPEFARNYTLTIQGLLNGYSIQKDGTIIVADDGIVVASNDESLLGQNTADNEVVQAMKKHTDSQHIYHLKNEGTGCYGIMLKQRDYYIYAYLPDTEVFHNLPLSVISVIFLYFLIFSIFCVLGHTEPIWHIRNRNRKKMKNIKQNF